MKADSIFKKEGEKKRCTHAAPLNVSLGDTCIFDSSHEDQIYMLSSTLFHEHPYSNQTRLLRIIVSSSGMKMAKSALTEFWFLKQTSLGLLLYLSTNSPHRLYWDLVHTANKCHDELLILFFFDHLFYWDSYSIPNAHSAETFGKPQIQLLSRYFYRLLFKGQLKEEYHIMQ